MTMQHKTAPSGASLEAAARGMFRPGSKPVVSETQEAAPAATVEKSDSVVMAAPAAEPRVASMAPPAMPVSEGPMDPAALAEACEKAGFPSLTVQLMRARASAGQVMERLSLATEIMSMSNRLNMGSMGRDVAQSGVSLEVARKLLNHAMASADEAIPTDARVTMAATSAQRPIDATQFYQRREAAKANGVKP